MVNIVIPERLSGRPLSALKIGDQHDLRMLGLMRGTEYMSCDQGAFPLQADDRLILLGKRPELRRFGDVL